VLTDDHAHRTEKNLNGGLCGREDIRHGVNSKISDLNPIEQT
ncbi:hypothetical protein TNIN_394411, partial [Trichonephila inaurata madagascariensis]